MFKHKYNDLLTNYEIREYEKKQHREGPLSLLHEAVKQKRDVFINLRSNRKVVAGVVAYDKHMNMVLERAIEIYREKGGGGQNRERKLGTMFLRGDNVVVIVLL
ncbi:UNVERIFIED_CONTAM: hypothetical protein PYX00_010868 [Menopon gallinae]|uniref:Small nuclear ribonucleoprotein Sm D2 n=1 Tax=Menopon gallinae TaxID=328185 RepID=A0AAW2H6C1_9NEOP